MAEPRFNPNHAAAGSATGGQFAPAPGGGGAAPAKGGGQKTSRTTRQQLLAEAHAIREHIRVLEKQLSALEKQHTAATAAAKHSAAQAKKAKKAGHVVHHRRHTATHRHHHRRAATLSHRIGHLRAEIRGLREKAASLEKQAKGKRDGSPDVTDERAPSDLKYGPGSALWKYWTTGEGHAKWAGAVHKWTTLRDLLLKAGVPASMANGLATNIIMAVLPGYMKQAHAKAGQANSAGRPGMDRADAKKPYGDVKYADPKNGKYPIDTKAHAMAAWSYINKPENAAKYPLNGVALSTVKARIKAACKKFGIEISGGGMNSSGPDGEYRTVRLAAPFAVTDSGDGLTFEGYAAVYNQQARIRGADGDFDEQIMPGAFRAIADGDYPVLMFEHGRHPLIGTMPLGKIRDAYEDDFGLWIEARLTDNWLISPVRDAVANEALDGMSFRFNVDDGGELWTDRSGELPLRSLTSLSVPELGPVVFPAYEPTTASVRSVLDNLPVIGRPPAGARAASGREEGDAAEYAEPDPTLSDLFRRDGEALALRGIRGVKLR